MRRFIIIAMAMLASSSLAYALSSVTGHTVPIGQIQFATAAIGASGSSGASASTVVSTSGAQLVGLTLPSALTSTTFTFKVCDTVDGTFVPLYNSSGAVSYSVGTSRKLSINPADFAGVVYFEIIPGTAEASARSIICTLKGM